MERPMDSKEPSNLTTDTIIFNSGMLSKYCFLAKLVGCFAGYLSIVQDKVPRYKTRLGKAIA